jgi:hypothetical protein
MDLLVEQYVYMPKQTLQKQRYYHSMRALFLASILPFTCTNLNSQQLLSFSVNGKLDSDTLTGKIYLYYPVNGIWIKDSCQKMKGAFRLSENLCILYRADWIIKIKRQKYFWNRQL